ncbi:MAG: hypothetical protein KC496_22650, partial [Anaerolineae bacterium]|nr:hypothetical protein [Anaerolineae bacterium]
MSTTRIKSRIGYNINAMNIPDMSRLLDHLRRVKPSVVVVMSSLELADTIYQMFDGECIVVSRDYSPQEGYEWWYTSP